MTRRLVICLQSAWAHVWGILSLNSRRWRVVPGTNSWSFLWWIDLGHLHSVPPAAFLNTFSQRCPCLGCLAQLCPAVGHWEASMGQPRPRPTEATPAAPLPKPGHGHPVQHAFIFRLFCVQKCLKHRPNSRRILCSSCSSSLNTMSAYADILVLKIIIFTLRISNYVEDKLEYLFKASAYIKESQIFPLQNLSTCRLRLLTWLYLCVRVQ